MINLPSLRKYTISIIIPYFNRSVLFPSTLASILKQSFQNFEVIIVDDGSEVEDIDKLTALIIDDPRIKFFKHQNRNQGPSFCRNFGVEKARGDFFLFLDSDDIITIDCLESRLNELLSNTSLDFAVFTQGVFYDCVGDSELIFSKFYDRKIDYLKSFIELDPPWQTSGVLWNAKSFRSLKNGFNINLRFAEDPELHVRAIVHNLQFEVFNRTPDFYYRLPKIVSNNFYSGSIQGRVKFLPLVYEMIAETNNSHGNYRTNFRIGLFGLLKNFLFWRITDYENEFAEIIEWANKNRIINFGDNLIINLLASKYRKHVIARMVPARILQKLLY